MTDSSTAQATGITEAQAADRLFARYQSADHDEGETQGEQPEPEEDTEVEAQADADEDSEGDPDADQDEADEDEQPSQTFKVKVNGEELDVPLDELLKGYSREQDYTRKTQAISEERKAALAEKQAAADARAQYAEKLNVVAQIIEASQPRVDQSLRETNPAEWSAQMLQHRQWADDKRGVDAERSRAAELSKAEEAKRLDALRVETIETLKAEIPEWKDPAVMDAEDKRLGDYVSEMGLTPDQISGLQTDPVAIKAIRKAMLFDELMARKPVVQDRIKAVKTMQPGPKTGPSRTDEKRARERLTSDGSTDAAVALLLARNNRRA